MSDQNVKINIKTNEGYDTLYPKTKANLVDFDKSNSNLTSTNVDGAIKEVDTKISELSKNINVQIKETNDAIKSTNTKIGELPNLSTIKKDNVINAINEVNEKANTIGSLSNLTTNKKNNIVEAVNDVNGKIGNNDISNLSPDGTITGALGKLRKRFVLIADSLGEGYGTTDRRGWTYYFKGELGLSDEDCYISQKGGHGFLAHEKGFLTLLNNASANVKDPDTITDVICLGGLNDSTLSVEYETLRTAVNEFVGTARQKFKNAQVHLGMLGRSKDNISCLNGIILRVVPALKQANCHYIENCESLCHEYWLYSDTWHLTTGMYQKIGKKIAHNYNSGVSTSYTQIVSNSNIRNNVSVNNTYFSNSNSYFYYSVTQNDSIINLFSGQVHLQFVNPLRLNGQQNVDFVFAKQNYNTLIRGNNQNSIPLNLTIGVSATSSGEITFYNITGYLRFNATDGSISLSFKNTLSGGKGYYSGYLRYVDGIVPSIALNALFC